MAFDFLKNMFAKKQYLYYGTNLQTLPMIQKEGLVSTRFDKGFLSLSEDEARTLHWSVFEVVLKIDKSKLDNSLLIKGLMADEIEYRGTISPENLIIAKCKQNDLGFTLNKSLN